MAGSNDFILHLSIEPVTSAKELQNSVNKIVKGVNPDAIQSVIDDKQTKSQIEKLLDLMADLKKGVEVPITVTGTALDDLGKIDSLASKLRKLTKGINIPVNISGTAHDDLDVILRQIDAAGQKSVIAGKNIANALNDSTKGAGQSLNSAISSAPTAVDVLSDKLRQIQDLCNSLTTGIKSIAASGDVNRIMESVVAEADKYELRILAIRQTLQEFRNLTAGQKLSMGFEDEIIHIEEKLNRFHRSLLDAKKDVVNFVGSLIRSGSPRDVESLYFSDKETLESQVKWFNDLMGKLDGSPGEYINKNIESAIDYLSKENIVLTEVIQKAIEAKTQTQSIGNIDMSSVFDSVIKAIDDCANKLATLMTTFSTVTGTAVADIGKIGTAFDEIANKGVTASDKIAKAFENVGASGSTGNAVAEMGKALDTTTTGASSNVDYLIDKLGQVREQVHSLTDGISNVKQIGSISKMTSGVENVYKEYKLRFDNIRRELNNIFEFMKGENLPDGFRDVVESISDELSKMEERLTTSKDKLNNFVDSLTSSEKLKTLNKSHPIVADSFKGFFKDFNRNSSVYMNDGVRDLTWDIESAFSMLLKEERTALEDTGVKAEQTKTQIQSIGDVDVSAAFGNIVNAITGCNDKLAELKQTMVAIGTTIDELGNKGVAAGESISKAITDAVTQISQMLKGVTVGDEITRVQEQLTSLLTGATSTDTTGNVGDIMQNALVSITEYEQRLNSLARSLAELRQFLDANGMQDKFVDITSGAAAEIEKARTSISGLKSDMERLSSSLTSTDKSGGIDKLLPLQDPSGYILQLDDMKRKIQQIAQGISDGLAKILADVPTQSNVLDTTATKVESVKTQAEGLQGIDLGAVFSSANGAISECSNKLSDLAGKLTTIIEILNTKSFGSGISSMATETSESFKNMATSASESLAAVGDSAKNAEANVSHSLSTMSDNTKQIRDRIDQSFYTVFRMEHGKDTVSAMLNEVNMIADNYSNTIIRLLRDINSLQKDASSNGITIFDDLAENAKNALDKISEEIYKVPELVETLKGQLTPGILKKTQANLTNKQGAIFDEPFRNIVDILTEQRDKVRVLTKEIVNAINEVYGANTSAGLIPMSDSVKEVQERLSSTFKNFGSPDLGENAREAFFGINKYAVECAQNLRDVISCVQTLRKDPFIPNDTVFGNKLMSLESDLHSIYSSANKVWESITSLKVDRKDAYKPLEEVSPDLRAQFEYLVTGFENVKSRVRAIALEIVDEINRIYTVDGATPQGDKLTAPIDKMQSSIQSIDPNVMNALASAIEKVTGIVSECNSKLSDMVTKLGDISNTVSGESGFGAIGKFASDILTEIGKVGEGFDSLSRTMSDFKINVDLSGIKKVGDTAGQVATGMSESFKSAESSATSSIKETEASASKSLGVMTNDVKQFRDEMAKGFIPRSIESNTNVKNTLNQLNVAADECAKHFENLGREVTDFYLISGFGHVDGEPTPLGEALFAKYKELNATVKEFKNIPNLTEALTEQLTTNELRRKPKNLSTEMGNSFNDIIVKLEEQKTKAQTIVQEIVDIINNAFTEPNVDGIDTVTNVIDDKIAQIQNRLTKAFSGASTLNIGETLMSALNGVASYSGEIEKGCYNLSNGIAELQKTATKSGNTAFVDMLDLQKQELHKLIVEWQVATDRFNEFKKDIPENSLSKGLAKSPLDLTDTLMSIISKFTEVRDKASGIARDIAGEINNAFSGTNVDSQAEQVSAATDAVQKSIQSIDPNIINVLASSIEKVTAIVGECNNKLSDMVIRLGEIFNAVGGENGIGAIDKLMSNVLTEIGNVNKGFESLNGTMSNFKININLNGIKDISNTVGQTATEMSDSFKSAESSTTSSFTVMKDEAKALRDTMVGAFADLPQIDTSSNVKNAVNSASSLALNFKDTFKQLSLQVNEFWSMLLHNLGAYKDGGKTPLDGIMDKAFQEFKVLRAEAESTYKFLGDLYKGFSSGELRRKPENLSDDSQHWLNRSIEKLESQKTRAQTLVQEIVDELNKVYNFDGPGTTSGGTPAELDVSKMFGNVDLSSQIGNMNALVESINEAVNAIKNMLGNTEGLKEKLASLDVSKLSQSLEGIVPRIDECIKKMRELGETVKTISSALGSEGVADTMTKINGAMDTITNNSGKLIGVLERLDTYLSKAGGTNPLSQQAEQAGASAAKISDALSSIDVNALSGLTTAIADAVAALEKLKDMANSFSKIEIKFDSTQLSTLVEQLTSIFQKLLESGNASNTASAAFSNVGSTIHTVAEEAKATTTVIDEMNQSLANSNLEVLTNATSQYSDVNKEELARIANSYANLGQSIESAKVQITDAAETGAQELQLLVTATNSAKQAVEETFNVGTMTTQLAEQTQQTSEEYYKVGESVDVLRQKLLYLYDAISRLPKNVVSKVIADEIDSIKQSFASTANGLDSFLKGQITDPAVLKDMETEADNLLERIINLRKVGVFDNISAGAEVASQNLRELNALVEETNNAYNFVLAGADRVINKDISGLGAYTPFYESLLAELRAQKDRLATQMGAVKDQSVTRETVAVANDLINALQQLVTLADAMGNLNKLELLPNFKDKADEVEAVKAAFESLYKSYKKIEGLKNTKQLPTYLNEQVSTLESKFNDLQTAALNIFKDGISSENDIRTFAQLAPEVYNLVNAINTASEAEKNYSTTTSGMVRNVSTQIQKMVKAESDRAKMTYKENAGGLQNFMALQQQSGKMIEIVRSINEFAKTNKGNTGDIGETMANNIEMAKEYAKRLSELRDGLSEYAKVAETTMNGDEVDGFKTRIEAVRVALANMIGALNGANSETGVSATNINETNNALAIALGNLEAYTRGTIEATRAEREANKVNNEREKTLRRLEDVRKRVAIALNVGSGAKYSNKTEVTEAYAGLKELERQLDDLKTKLNTNDKDGRLVGIGIDEAKRNLESFTGSLRQNEGVLKSNGFYMKSFGQRMKEVANYFATWFSMSRMIMQTIRTIKNMIKTSIELDDAMTQMQIVTHANSNTMKEFADSAADAAKRIGSSITDFMSSATTFARLGYNMEESSQLAEYVAMLQNVGNIDTQDAQDAVTAIIKAFDIDADQIESVMDKLVVTGNRFPISVEQIAEGMTNAASALAASGNSFEQSVALLTASNAVVQNASKAATGLRTITARLRNTKTELDDLGEAMTSSQYDELTRALTKQGVALVDINGEYRSTYDIISDIAKVWDNMTSMEQSALATLMSGKLCARMYRNMHRRHI